MSAASKKKSKKVGAKGVVHIRATFNNTLITITDTNGNTIAWGAPGKAGYKGSRKSTPFAAQQAAQRAAETVVKMGMRDASVRVKGPGAGRESAIRGLSQGGLRVSGIEDCTPLPHNGCRAPKKRRV
jgi:small subunit ribosomal protein S11